MAHLGLPPGFRFLPTDEELLTAFLYKKLFDKLPPVETMLIPEYNLYGKEEPSLVFEKFASNITSLYHGNDLYFFTKLNKKVKKGSRIERSAGGGSWHGENKGDLIEVEVVENNDAHDQRVRVKGLMKRFKYRNKNNSEHDQCGCGWIMHEFSLPEFNNEIVLCRLRKSEPRGVRVVAACNDEPVVKKRKVEAKEEKSELMIMKNPELMNSNAIDGHVNYDSTELKNGDSLLNMGMELDNYGINTDIFYTDTFYGNNDNDDDQSSLSMDGNRDEDLDAFIQSLLVQNVPTTNSDIDIYIH